MNIYSEDPINPINIEEIDDENAELPIFKDLYSHNSNPDSYDDVKTIIENKLKFGYSKRYCNSLIKDEIVKFKDKYKVHGNIYLFNNKNDEKNYLFYFEKKFGDPYNSISFYFLEPEKQKDWQKDDLKKNIEMPLNYYENRIRPYSYITIKYTEFNELGGGFYEKVYFNRGYKYPDVLNELSSSAIGMPFYADPKFEVAYWADKNMIVEIRSGEEGVLIRYIHTYYCYNYIKNFYYRFKLKTYPDIDTYLTWLKECHNGKRYFSPIKFLYDYNIKDRKYK